MVEINMQEVWEEKWISVLVGLGDGRKTIAIFRLSNEVSWNLHLIEQRKKSRMFFRNDYCWHWHMEQQWKVTLAMDGWANARSSMATTELHSELKQEVLPDLLLQTTETAKLEWKIESNKTLKIEGTHVHDLGSVFDHLRAMKGKDY